MLAFTKTHLIVLILTSTKSNEAQSAQTSAWCSVPAKLDSSTRLPTSLSKTPKFSTKQNDILPLRIFKTDWLTHCRTKHDYLSMVKFKSVHFSRSDEVCFFFLLDFHFKNHVSWPCWQNPCQAPRGHITWKISTLILVAPLSTIREMKAWASRDEPVPTCALDDLIGVTEICSNGIQNSISQKTLQSRPRLVYLWSSQTLFEGHPQKRSPEYSSRIYLSLCPGCQRQLCDCSKTLLGHRLKPHVLVNFPALISP